MVLLVAIGTEQVRNKVFLECDEPNCFISTRQCPPLATTINNRDGSIDEVKLEYTNENEIRIEHMALIQMENTRYLSGI